MNSSLFSPDYSHLTGLLKHLNDEELTELLNSEEKLKTIVGDLKQVKYTWVYCARFCKVCVCV